MGKRRRKPLRAQATQQSQQVIVKRPTFAVPIARAEVVRLFLWLRQK
jgi:hypothetical protein